MIFKLSHISASLDTEEGIRAAVLQSIGNWEKAEKTDGIDPDDSKNGWWAREILPSKGCRDWTLSRAKLTDDTVKRAVRLTKKALEWLIDDGHIYSLDITGTTEANRINRLITIKLKNSSKLEIVL